MDPSKLKREDFSFEANDRGYILIYKDMHLGGAGILRSDFGNSEEHTPEQVVDHGKLAEEAIQRILIGKSQHYLRLIDEINGM